MIYSASGLVGKPVVSIRINANIGQISGVLLNPDRLSVAGLWIKTNANPRQLLLLNDDIRQLTSQRAIVDDHNQLVEPSELPKLRSILTINYIIPGKKIVADGRKIGVALDFNFNNETYLVSHIIARASGLQRLRVSQLTFERRQITAIDNRKITVNIDPQAQQVPSLGPTPI